MSEKFKNSVNKKVGKNVIARGDEILQMPRIPTGSLSLDVETGGGIPVGRITSIVGPWSSGKTSITLKIAGEYQKRWPDRDIVWIDAEGVWDPKWSRSLGLDPTKVYVVRPEYGEQAYNIALGAIDDGAGLIVIDSVAALASKSEMEGDMESIQVAAMARVNAKFMRKMGGGFSELEAPPTLIYLNQLRQNVGGYGPPLIEPGGEALSFYPSLKIVTKMGELFDGKKTYKTIGVNDEGVEAKAQVIKFYTEKNKTAPFKRRGHWWFYFDTLDSARKKGSYDRLEEIIRYTLKYDIVTQRGSIYDLVNPKTGELRSFKGSGALAEYIRDNDDVTQWVEEVVMQRVVEDMSGAPISEDGEEEVSEEQVARLRAVDLDEEEGSESSKGTGS